MANLKRYQNRQSLKALQGEKDLIDPNDSNADEKRHVLQVQIDEIRMQLEPPVEVAEALWSALQAQKEQEAITPSRHFETDKEREKAITEEAERLFNEMRLSPDKETSVAETFKKGAKNRKDQAKLPAQGNEREHEAEILRQVKETGQVAVKIASTASNSARRCSGK